MYPLFSISNDNETTNQNVRNTFEVLPILVPKLMLFIVDNCNNHPVDSLLFDALVSWNFVASNNKLMSQIINYHIKWILQSSLINNIIQKLIQFAQVRADTFSLSLSLSLFILGKRNNKIKDGHACNGQVGLISTVFFTSNLTFYNWKD